MENMKIKSMSSVPRAAIGVSAVRRVLKISYSPWYFLISLNTLPILRVRKITPKMETDSPTPAHVRMRITRVKKTTMKSN